jgi:hypothetical protein
MTEARLAEPGTSIAFTTPDAMHSPAAYWFWHQLPTARQIREQIGQMLDGGYRSFQIQARLAYPIGSYLNDEYLAACQVAVQEAARLGMTVGIYDEYNWQSGQAGGRTVHGRDDLRERHVFWASVTAEPAGDGSAARCTVDQIHSSAADLGPAGLAWQYDDGRVVWTDWELIAVLGYPADIGAPSQIQDVTSAARIARSDDAGCTVEVVGGPELARLQITAFVAARSSTSRVPNYLLPETARRFIETGYEPFRRAFGEHFGTTVRYVFFDQPHATFHDWPQRHGNLRSSLPYAPGLAEAVRAQTGGSFEHALLALVTDVGPKTRSLRCGFYQAFTDLACSGYLGPLAAWCDEHGLALSGHEVLGHVGSWHPSRAFSTWDLRVNFGLDYFGLDAYRDITGVDAQDCVPQLSAKMGDSVARSNGRSGCIVEQYMGRSPGAATTFAGHWGLTLEELRAQAIRLTLSGARQFLFHAFYQTDGRDGDPSLFTNPRFDFPPGINFEPWWPFHRAFADETARLSAFLDEAAPACDVAVLYPLRTIWAEGAGHGYGDHLEFWTSFLAKEGFGFHLIDERDLLRAQIRDGRLCLGDRAYPCLVLPSVTTLGSPASIAALLEFAAGGGLLVSSGQVPGYSQDGQDEEIRSAWASVAADISEGRRFGGVPDPAAARELLAPLLAGHPHARAEAALAGYPVACVEDAPAGQLWQWAGTDADGWRIALFNDSTEPVSVTIATALPAASWQEWNPATGRCSAWSDETAAAGPQLPISMQPMELRLFRLRPAPAAVTAGAPADVGSWPGGASSRTGPSVPLAGGWTLRVPGRADDPVPVDVSHGWELQGFADYSGAGAYSCQFDRPSPGAWRLRLPDVRAAAEVRLNGELIGARAWAPYEFELPAGILRPTANQLEVVVYSAAGNKYYAGTPYQEQPEASGLLQPPVLDPI